MQTIFYFIFFSCCIITDSFACNTSDHHSVLSHYNHAKKIFEGKVLKIGKEHQKNYSFEDHETGVRSIFVKLEVSKNYKNTAIKEQILVGILPGVEAAFKLGGHYLIYANAKAGYDFLVCEKGFLMSDTIGLATHQFLFQIPLNHTGWITEYSSEGHIWSEGKLENGLAVGAWTFYSKTGELQIKGQYFDGEEVGTWFHYYHTIDDNYRIFQQIWSGAYFELTGTYKLLALDTLENENFKYQICYLVEQDTVVEAFGYNRLLLQKTVQFEQGFRQGKEERFDEHGHCISSYTFEKDILNGAFFELQFLHQQDNIWLRVEGTYKNDKKIDEEHLYYENEQLIKTKIVLLNGQLME